MTQFGDKLSNGGVWSTIHNPNCDGAHCTRSDSEVRVLSTGGDSNAILCHSCFNHELNYRQLRNIELGTAHQFKLPTWLSLRVYTTGE